MSLARSAELRQRVLEKIAPLPASFPQCSLNYFPITEVKSAANRLIGSAESLGTELLSEATEFLSSNPDCIVWDDMYAKIRLWRQMSAVSCGQILYLIHSIKGTSLSFLSAAERREIYSLAIDGFSPTPVIMALLSLSRYVRSVKYKLQSDSIDDSQVLDILSSFDDDRFYFFLADFFDNYDHSDAPAIPEILRQSARIADRFKVRNIEGRLFEKNISSIESFMCRTSRAWS